MKSNFGDNTLVRKGASFATIGIKDADGCDCVRLSDLKVTGYDPGTYVWGEAVITMLENDGRNTKCTDGETNLEYFWIDDGEDGLGGYPPGWYGPDFLPMTEEGGSIAGIADEITFAAGEGICFTISSGSENWQLQSSGQVLNDPEPRTFGDNTLVLIANPLPRRVTLNELVIGGYDPGTYVWGEAVITMLENDGRNTKCTDGETNLEYFWIDDGEDGLGGYPPGWYGPDFLPMTEEGGSIAGDATKIGFEASEGFYFTITSGSENWFVKFPSLGLKAE